MHSVRCPGIAARIATDGFTLVYAGDIVAFEDADAALSGADLYIGDGSTLTGSLVRRHQSGALIGHTTVRAQLGWLVAPRDPARDLLALRQGADRDGRRTRSRRPSPSSRPRRLRAARSRRRATGWSSRSGLTARAAQAETSRGVRGAAPGPWARPESRAARPASPEASRTALRASPRALDEGEQAARPSARRSRPRRGAMSGLRVTSTESDSTVAAWNSSAGFLETPVRRTHDGAVVGGDGEDADLPAGQARDRPAPPHRPRAPSRWKTYLSVTSCLEPSGGVIVRSVRTRIVFSPRIMAERSALKSRNVKPVPSMFVVVPLVSRTSRPMRLGLARGRTTAARRRGRSRAELRIAGIGHQLVGAAVHVHLRVRVEASCPFGVSTRTSIACLRPPCPGTTRRKVSVVSPIFFGTFTGSVSRCDARRRPRRRCRRA